MYIYGVALLACLSQITTTAFAQDYNFDQAWQRYLDVSNTLVAERENVDKAQSKKQAAKYLYAPEITLSARYIHLDQDVELEPETIFKNMKDGGQTVEDLLGLAGQVAGGMGIVIDPSQLNSALTTTLANQDTITSSLTAVWPIYTGGRINAAQDIVQGQYLEALERQSLTTRQQFVQLVQRYFGVVFAEQVYQTRLRVEQGLEGHLNNAILLEREGQIAKVERLQAEASRDKARIERRSAEHGLAIARNGLTTMLVESGETIPVDSLFYNEELPALHTFVTDTKNHYAGLGILKSKKDQATGMVDVEKGAYHPEVALLGNYSLYEDDSLAMELAPEWFVGVNVSFTLLDRQGRSDKLAAARSSVRQVNALIAQAETDITLLCEQYYRQAIQAREEYHGFASSIQLAEESLRLRTKAFTQGLSTSLDVVDAETFVAGMQIRRSQAQYNYILALSQLLSLSGKIDNFGHYQEMAANNL